MVHACRRASAFISRFKTRDGRFILTHFIESIQSEMESLLDCYGNRWEKAVSVSLCASFSGEEAAWYASTGLTQVTTEQHDVQKFAPLKINSWGT